AAPDEPACHRPRAESPSTDERGDGDARAQCSPPTAVTLAFLRYACDRSPRTRLPILPVHSDAREPVDELLIVAARVALDYRPARKGLVCPLQPRGPRAPFRQSSE